ncbi:hypothetical protein HDU92_004385 [Lobulomyces angularis]|nr:hypothetical protein HDU92_004385 [Lobulomyces angularis]
MTSNKLHYLDGLRGFAALQVLHTHYPDFKYWILYNGSPSPQNYYQTLLGELLAGTSPFAVTIFFVLSGRVMANGILKNPKVEVLFSAIFRRFFRLLIPLLGSYSIYYIFLSSGIAKPDREALELAKGTRFGAMFWIYGYYDWAINQMHWYGPLFWTLNLLNNGFGYNVFPMGIWYNAWTIPHEIYQSLVVFLKKDPANNFIDNFEIKYRNNIWGTKGIGNDSQFNASSMWAYPSAGTLAFSFSFMMLLELNSIIQWIFSLRIMKFLGKISFGMYLSHPMFLVSLYPKLVKYILQHPDTFKSYSPFQQHLLVYLVVLMFLAVYSLLFYYVFDKGSIYIGRSMHSLFKNGIKNFKIKASFKPLSFLNKMIVSISNFPHYILNLVFALYKNIIQFPSEVKFKLLYAKDCFFPLFQNESTYSEIQDIEETTKLV